MPRPKHAGLELLLELRRRPDWPEERLERRQLYESVAGMRGVTATFGEAMDEMLERFPTHESRP